MSGTTRTTALIALALTFWAAPILAQTRDRGPLVLELASSTRAAALGNAFALGFRDSDALFYQPGLLNQAQGQKASFQRFGANGTLTGLSAARSWFGGGVALGVQHLTYEAPLDPAPTVDDILLLPADEATLRDPGTRGASETALSVGYGKTVMGARFGAVGKYVEQRLGTMKASSVALDLGLAASPGPLTVGLAVQNIGPGLSLGGGEIPLPTRFSLGASSQTTPVGPLDLSASTALAYRLDGDLIPSVGVEVGYWPVNGRTFVGRVGYRYLSENFSAVPFTFGGAFWGDDIILEYAFQGFEEGDPTHRFGIGWR